MNISELSINRPVLATVMNIIVVIFWGGGAYFLGCHDYPAIDPPVISVSALLIQGPTPTSLKAKLPNL
ncbi:MAG: hypothetical protein R2822_19010 [Spirosomataceae bacterium]